MKATVQESKVDSQNSPQMAQRRGQVQSEGATTATQRAAQINASPRVQSLAQLREQIHQSPRLLGQLPVNGGAGEAVQGKPREEKLQAKPKEEKLQSKLKEEKIQGKAKEEKLQGKPKEEKLQAKPKEELRQRRDADTSSSPGASPEATSGSSASGLPPQLKSGVESLSGMSMDHVQVHLNSDKPAQLNALAYAQGSEIHVGPGQEQHLPHEAWHVVQQAQGRVQPTKQMKDGVAINDDKALEHEADVMGRKSAGGAASQEGGSKQLTPRRTKNRSTQTVQAIMSVAEFQAATPGTTFKPRKGTGVVLIDQALQTYIQGRTIANANNLIGIIKNYVGGNHDAGRKLVAGQLLQRADAEHQVLQQIGNQNAFLVDALIEQAGMPRLAQLVQLATDATPAGATILPHLIDTVGDANINNLNTSKLVQYTGALHLSLLPAMIVQSGGIGERINLANVINRHPGQGHLAFDLTREAAGNAKEFSRLAKEVPTFLKAKPPGAGALPGLPAAMANYNAAPLGKLQGALTIIKNSGNIAHKDAMGLGGVNAGLLGNVAKRINQVGVRLGALAAPGAVGGPLDVQAANDARNIIFVALKKAVVNLAVPLPGTFAPAVNAVDQANTNAANAAVAPSIAKVSEDHFLTRHTPMYFNFGEIKDDNTQWDTSWAGNTIANLDANFTGVLNGLVAAENWLKAGVKIPNQACPVGGTAQIAGKAGAAANLIEVGQFYPEHNPGAQNLDHPASTMRAIEKVV
ncbi:MAG: DUF4157 domain-containing protein [Terracidiphilus sp.]|jgi:hypothetical protein